jgi:hypothetical protein
MRSILHSLVLAPALFAAAALAPNSAMAEAVVNVPFNFTVDGKVCPAGQYSVRRDPIKNEVFLRSEKAPIGFHWFLAPGDDDRKPSTVTLHFNQDDQNFTLQTVEYGRLTTHSLVRKPKHSSRDMERIVQGQGQ